MSFKIRSNNKSSTTIIKSYTQLNNLLMSKLDKISNYNENQQFDQLGFVVRSNKYQYVEQDQKYIQSSKTANDSEIQFPQRKSKLLKTRNNTFLTGINLANQQEINNNVIQKNYHDQQVYENNLLKELPNTDNDDLVELRKMIRQTDKKLTKYGSSLTRTKNHVYGAALKIGKKLDPALEYKIQKQSEYLPKIEVKKGSKGFRKSENIKYS